MIYYLISEGNEYKICFVKEEDSAGFHHRCAGRILVHGTNILKLLSLFDKELVKDCYFNNN